MKKFSALVAGPLLLVALIIPLLCSCSATVADLANNSPREEYQAFLHSRVSTAKAIDLKTLSAGLVLKALPFSQNVESRGRLLFLGDPQFTAETAAWKRGGPIIILMGLFTPDLGEKDVTATGRFRPALKTPDGAILKPLAIKRYGRDSVFMRDYFPAFDPWEEVFVISFDPGRSAGDFDPAAYEFILEWPGGVKTLPLGQNIPAGQPN